MILLLISLATFIFNMYFSNIVHIKYKSIDIELEKVELAYQDEHGGVEFSSYMTALFDAQKSKTELLDNLNFVSQICVFMYIIVTVFSVIVLV